MCFCTPPVDSTGLPSWSCAPVTALLLGCFVISNGIFTPVGKYFSTLECSDSVTFSGSEKITGCNALGLRYELPSPCNLQQEQDFLIFN